MVNKCSLGIHIGHNASCAVVSDNVLLSALQQERITRYKHDGCDSLTNSLPVHECLEVAGFTWDNVDHVVTCFQAASPGGFGLHNPLIHHNFSLFDPTAKNHLVISHHLAHAYCAYGLSPFDEAVVLVSDLGGSSTIDGNDFVERFSDWYKSYTSLNQALPVKTENLSIYSFVKNKISLLEREYCIPHNAPEFFIQSPASLFKNVSFCVFQQDDAYGKLMGLAGYSHNKMGNENNISKDDIIKICENGKIFFKNDWQHLVSWRQNTMDYSYLAQSTQLAFEEMLLSYVRRAKKLANQSNLAVAGGPFLNILSNTKISQSKIFENYFVPSAPHDAGIAIGCAFYGDSLKNNNKKTIYHRTDRLGPSYSLIRINNAIKNKTFFLKKIDPLMAARDLANGLIVARCVGRSEFGPRALGGRSLLASPLLSESKDLLNKIKKRQYWRPVAPIVLKENAHEYFIGPEDSPFMNYAHDIRAKYREKLPALHHPDGTTRVQTLEQCEDDALYELISQFKILTGYPILVNTSLNGPNQPIIETPEEAIEFFLNHSEIDGLLLGDSYIKRKESWEDLDLFSKNLSLNKEAFFTLSFSCTPPLILVTLGGDVVKISEETYIIITNLGKAKNVGTVLTNVLEKKIKEELYMLLIKNILILI